MLSIGRRDLSGETDKRPEINFAGATSDEMAAALYDELRRLAQRERWKAGRPDSWQTTQIMHEAYLKLYNRENWASREHFLGTAVTTMRHILIDAARARLAAKRGAGVGDLPLDDAQQISADLAEDRNVVRLGDALKDLATLDPKLAKLVDCRFFAGLSDGEAAKIMGVSDRTVQRWWAQARAWIHSELELAS